jgi:hypothetical protein
MPIALPRQRARCCIAAARAAAPAPSATLWVSVNSARMAAATSSSLTATTSSASRRITSSASGTGVRQAMPSASRVLTGASSTRPARNESRYAVACADTTPTSRVLTPQCARAAAAAAKPEPSPIGTNSTSGGASASASKNST